MFARTACPLALFVLVFGGCGATPPQPAPAPLENVAAATPPAAAPPASSECERTREIDEVWCVLQNYPHPCCDGYNKVGHAAGSSSTTSTGTSALGLPDALSADMIRDGLSSVRGSIVACGAGTAGHRVKLRVKVAPDGRPVDVSIAEADDQALGECVAAAVRKATFTATVAGGVFSIPYLF